MDIEAFEREAVAYYAGNPDLMRHLSPGSSWQYIVHESSLEDPAPVLVFYLEKLDHGSLRAFKTPPEGKTDLILYYTVGAIRRLIEGNPTADEYYARYRAVMHGPSPGIELDSKVNKSKIALFKQGYKSWQADFRF